MKYSVRPSDSKCYNVLFGGFNEYSLAGEYITTTLNGTMYSYEMAPVFNYMENAVINFVGKEMVGWKQEADGIFTPGGSFANFYSLILSRYWKFGDQIKKEGMFGLKKMKIFTSELAHYSIEKAACSFGFGLNNVVKIPTDKKGKMIPEELEKAIIECI